MTELAIILACVALNAVFAGIEMAFVAMNKPVLRELARTGNRAALRVLKLRDHPERTLSVIQIGITLVGAVAAAVGGVGAEEVISPFLERTYGLTEGTAEAVAILLVVVPLTYVSVVLGELVPKSLALRHPQPIVFVASRGLVLLDKALSPVVSFLERSTKMILKVLLVGSKLGRDEAVSPEPEARFDQLSRDHREYVLNLVNLEKKRVRDICLPWQQVVCVNVSQEPSEVETVILNSGHTRLPVTEGEKVVGILHTKEFLAFQKAGSSEWNSIIRPALSVDQNDPLLRVLKLMQESKSHLSVVISGGQRSGIVTLEDIFEEIVGDVFDEDDDGSLKRFLTTRALRSSVEVGRE